ncbi:glycosyltransferase [Rhizobium sp. BK376]|uniref:glycosyltransferase n=1 Tax=Rhizobium sp. BK376 TaxID=2512149 RepID=UPI001048EABA|nr:glycosyltransferase [Rhizobium sp. BK376]TCR71850.1 GT2 family glycosyltransferase [Rhizobium sp. BK376]
MEENLGGITLVTVTYGDRLVFLSSLLNRAFNTEGIENAIIVDNGSRSDLSLLEAEWGNRIKFVKMGGNTGSAAGYGAGIEAALKTDARFLLLMDDDNAPAEGSTFILFRELIRLRSEVGNCSAAVSGFRAGRSTHLKRGRAAFPAHSNFMGFHIKDLPYKILRYFDSKSKVSDPPSETIQVPYAPYGGLLAGREVFEKNGLPKKDFVLYADDWEYTLRFTRSGGIISVVTNAPIDDLEQSWFEGGRRESIFKQSLTKGADFRLYYTFRNHVWINVNMQKSSPLLYRINKWMFISIIYVYAVYLNQFPRYYLIRRAIRDGELEKLGIDSEFRLS